KGKRTRTDKVYPESYGGAYIDDNGKLVICITDSSANVHTYRYYADNGTASLKGVQYSVNTLKGVMDRMNAHVKEHPEGLIAQNMDFFAIDERNNRIIMDVKQLNKSYEEQFRSVITDASCVVLQDEGGALENTAQYTLGRGEMLEVLHGIYLRSFSLGIRAKLDGEDGFITTGHIPWQEDDDVMYAGNTFAKFVKYKAEGSVDAAFCEIINDNYEIDGSAGGTIGTDGLQGQVVAYGSLLGGAEGRIENVSASASFPDGDYTNLTRFRLNNAATISEGDSGGGVFSSSGDVHGVIKGRDTNNHSVGFYSKASEIASALGVTIE